MSASQRVSRFRLNGWQRMGIVLSVVWAIVGGIWGLNLVVDPIWAEWRFCITQQPVDWEGCRQSRALQIAGPGKWYGAAIVGLTPIPIAWLIVYGIVGLVRWIRAGFQGRE